MDRCIKCHTPQHLFYHDLCPRCVQFQTQVGKEPLLYHLLRSYALFYALEDPRYFELKLLYAYKEKVQGWSFGSCKYHVDADTLSALMRIEALHGEA